MLLFRLVFNESAEHVEDLPTLDWGHSVVTCGSWGTVYCDGTLSMYARDGCFMFSSQIETSVLFQNVSS